MANNNYLTFLGSEEAGGSRGTNSEAYCCCKNYLLLSSMASSCSAFPDSIHEAILTAMLEYLDICIVIYNLAMVDSPLLLTNLTK